HVDFVKIVPGSFLMGCSSGDEQCYPEEKPAHRVVISHAFEIGKYLVTQSQYEPVFAVNPSYFHGPKLPVEGVSWEDAQKFCEALTAKKDGYGYRLPTEAEWEYAARAGDARSHYGNLEEISWYRDNAGGSTHPVGGKKPNVFGLYDTLGNVWEWVN